MLSANDACFREGLSQPEATRTNQELLRRCLLVVLLLCLCAVHKAYAYDPMLVSENGAFTVKDTEVMDGQRERSIPIRSYIPNRAGSLPIVLFSHGLGGSREGSSFLGKHWAARGTPPYFCNIRVVIQVFGSLPLLVTESDA